MRLFLAALLILSSCSSKKKDKALEKALEESSHSPMDVEVKAPVKLLEKFEVSEVTETKPVSKPAPRKISPSVAPKVVVGKKVEELVKKVTPKKLPTDYPEEFIELNKKAQAVWKLYKPNHTIDEKIFLDINYLGMTIGKIMFTNKGKKMVNDREVWHFHARFKSSSFYSNIYELDDTVDTFVATPEFLTMRYSLIQRESKQSVDDLQLYDREQLKTFSFYKQERPNKKVKNKEKEGFIPFFSIDPFSVAFFFQGLPLNNGDIYEIPLVNKGKVMILKTVVEGREKVNTDLKDGMNAIRVHATTQYSGETLKSGDIYLWFSDDEKKTLIKAQAKIKIGSVTADLVEIK